MGARDEAHATKILTRCLFVVGRVASGRLHVRENERRKVRLARVDERGNAEGNRLDLVSVCREISRAGAGGEPRCVREFGVFRCANPAVQVRPGAFFPFCTTHKMADVPANPGSFRAVRCALVRLEEGDWPLGVRRSFG